MVDVSLVDVVSLPAVSLDVLLAAVSLVVLLTDVSFVVWFVALGPAVAVFVPLLSVPLLGVLVLVVVSFEGEVVLLEV